RILNKINLKYTTFCKGIYLICPILIIGKYDGCIFTSDFLIMQCEIPGLVQPEGIAVDTVHRKLFWVDSGKDRIETSDLDGRNRKVVIDSDLVNPRAIVMDAKSGTLYWTDWNRDAPKIESSSLKGHKRKVLVDVFQDALNYPFSLAIYDSHFYYTDWERDGIVVIDQSTGKNTASLPIQQSHLYGTTLIPSQCL
uniref:Uncharacterized protein n=1 Tax=Cyprinus carpio TaxID=7962 RepID=A0A8C1GLZ9_CYPCA